MTENRYLPEGRLIFDEENEEALSSVQSLEKAMAAGRIIEALAILCDSGMNLIVDLKCIKGIIRKEEVVYSKDDEPIKDIAVISRVGKPVAFKIMGFEKGKDGATVAILSRREAQRECMREYLMTLSCGDILDAKITHLEHFGAFVDIGCGIASLLSIDSISVSRISHPKDRFTSGMYIKAIIKSIDKELERIYVTHKELLGTWEENASEFCIGQTVSGIVRSIENYGIFIELTPNLAGLAEIKEDHPLFNSIEVGDAVSVYIKSIIPDKMKIKLILIDFNTCAAKPTQLHYYIDTKETKHITHWQYSPAKCSKLVETVFE